MKPIVKKALAAVAAKEIYERVQEARAPKKPSLLGRLFKVTVAGALLGGAYYAYKSGMFGGRGSEGGSEGYDGSLTYQGPRDDLLQQSEPVGTPVT
ncbi:MAG: hypothetical protein ACRDKZ_03975 [Actinomycetota bacterium]